MNRGKRGMIGLLVVLLLVLIIPSVSAQQGCFTEPTASTCEYITETFAKNLCGNDDTCMSTYFFDGVDCDTVSICQSGPGWCADDCSRGQVDNQAECVDRNSFIPGITQPEVCEVGCCVCGSEVTQGANNICEYGQTQSECSESCVTFGTGFIVERFDKTIDSNTCLNTCTTATGDFSTLQGFVFDENAAPLSDVSVTILGKTGISAADGFYQVTDVPAGVATLQASKPGFVTFFDTVTLTSGQIIETNMTLISTGIGTFQGTVMDNIGSLLSDVTISVTGPVVDQQTTITDGKFLFSLPAGSYTVEAIKSGFETITFTLDLAQGIVEERSINLSQKQLGVIRGRISDPDGGSIPFAQVLVNGEPKTYSSSAGFYSLTLPATLTGTSYQISVTQKPHFQDATPITVNLTWGADITKDFVLQRAVGSCFYPLKPAPASFDAHHVQGEASVRLIWPRPCPEVDGFIIERFLVQEGIGEVLQLTTFVDVGIPTENFEYLDEELEWQVKYKYTIKAVYLDGDVRASTKVDDTITLGDPRCEGRYLDFTFVEFCEDDRNRAVCNDQNIVEPALETQDNWADCSRYGDQYYCSGPDLSLDTFCRDAGVCSSQSRDANPFGLFFTKNTCYEFDTNNEPQNFCYFDTSNSIFDACYACTQVETCFDYINQDACEINNCQASPIGCSWVSAATQFGTGYCVEDEYEGVDHCADCSSQSLLFENSQCTADICSALGACYSNADQSSCNSCNDDSTCYDFASSSECIGGQPTSRQLGERINSLDQCTLGTCTWDSSGVTINPCFKDGNADGDDDCASYSGNIFDRCAKDNTPPETKVSPSTGNVVINAVNQEITFSATDENNVLDVTYCVDRYNTCNPDRSEIYTGSQVTVNITEAIDEVYAGPSNPEDITYYLRFFSQDDFDNLENVQSRTLDVDRDPPEFINLSYTIDEKEGGSSIHITIATDEFASCTDELKNLRGGSLSQLPSTPAIFQQITYGEEPDSMYTYTVTCEDSSGNTATGQLLILVDAIHFVDVVSPPLVTREDSLNFILSTSDAFECDLYEGNTFQEKLSTTDFLSHTSSIYSFTANQFYGDWHAQCSGVGLGGLSDSVSIPFTIDTAPPLTTLVLTSEDGTIRKFTSTGWQGWLSGLDSSISLDCEDSPINGFGCKESLFCLTSQGASCTPNSTYSDPISDNLDEEFKICYRSIDEVGAEEQTKCGTVRVTPTFGVQLIDPPEFTYDGLKFGVSNKDIFDLTISSIVQTDICKYSGFKGFNFTELISSTRIFKRIGDANHKKENFSSFNDIKSSYDKAFASFIQCNSSINSALGPKEQFNFVIDKSPPVISSAIADPSKVISGNTVSLVVETDDPTICRFDKNATSFENMIYSFPDLDKRVFKTSHRAIVSVSALDDKQSISYNVACQNGAGNNSQPKAISYSVDFSVAGSITSFKPSGVFKDEQVTLEVKTNKPAFCTYFSEGGSQVTTAFTSHEGGRTHNSSQDTSEEKSYHFFVSCQFDEARRDGAITFTIDRTAPIITSINDGNSSCSLKSITPNFIAQDNGSSIARFDYGVFSRGSSTSIASGSVTSSSVTITGLNLTNGEEYVIKAKAVDSAGNIGQEEVSDGFLATTENVTECKEKNPPRLSLIKTQTTTGVQVQINCDDDTGCNSITYGVHPEADECETSKAYISSFIVDRTSYVCYEAVDNAGNIGSGIERIVIDDCDGDGVADSIDQCGTIKAGQCSGATPAGSIVGSDGCEATSDRDEDRLEDEWEARYNAADCPLDPLDADSDDDGISDDEEDYDGDGLTNYQEFREHSDPCIAPDSDGDGIPDHLDTCPDTPSSELDMIITDESNNQYGCSPSEEDTDGDGMPDKWETDNGLDPNNPADAGQDKDHDTLTNLEEYELKNRFATSTNPNEKDTDDDGFSDNEELIAGTDPVNSSSFPSRSSVIPLILIILGLLLIIGGAGTAFYLAKKKTGPRISMKPSQRIQPPARPRPRLKKPSFRDAIRRKREKRAEQRRKKRSNIFNLFSSTAPKKEPVPKLDQIVRKKSSEFDRLAQLTKHYSKSKKKLSPKLSTDEKKIFRELEEISNKVGGAHIASKSELRKLFETEGTHMKDVFKELSEKIFTHENKNKKK